MYRESVRASVQPPSGTGEMVCSLEADRSQVSLVEPYEVEVERVHDAEGYVQSLGGWGGRDLEDPL